MFFLHYYNSIYTIIIVYGDYYENKKNKQKSFYFS